MDRRKFLRILQPTSDVCLECTKTSQGSITKTQTTWLRNVTGPRSSPKDTKTRRLCGASSLTGMQADSRGGGQLHDSGEGLGKRLETAGYFNPRNRGRRRDATQVQGPSTRPSQAAHSSLLLTCVPPPALIISASGMGSRRGASSGGPCARHCPHALHSTVTTCYPPVWHSLSVLCQAVAPQNGPGCLGWGREGAWSSRQGRGLVKQDSTHRVQKLIIQLHAAQLSDPKECRVW